MPETLPEVAKQFVASFDVVCKSMRILIEDYKCEIEEVEPEYVLISINDGEQYVQIDEQEVENETIFGNGKGKRVCYTIQHSVYDPGVRYYPDGSGEPPSWDVVDDCTVNTAWQAIEKALSLNFQMNLQNVIECIAMSEQEAEAQKAEQDYYAEMEITKADPPTEYDFTGNEKSQGLGYGR